MHTCVCVCMCSEGGGCNVEHVVKSGKLLSFKCTDFKTIKAFQALYKLALSVFNTSTLAYFQKKTVVTDLKQKGLCKKREK